MVGEQDRLANDQRGERDLGRRSDRQPRALCHKDSDQTDDVQSDQEEDGWWQYGQKFFLQLFDSFVHSRYSYVLPAVLYSLTP